MNKYVLSITKLVFSGIFRYQSILSLLFLFFVSPLVQGSSSSSIINDVIAKQLAAKLLNSKYEIKTRRTESAINKEYIYILDKWFDPLYGHNTYPLNSVGSLARMPHDSMEFFINIPKLYAKIKKVSKNQQLLYNLEQYEKNNSFSQIRDLMISALGLVGKKDYEIEWQSELTRDRYDIDLTDMATAYSVGNLKVAKVLIHRLSEWQRKNKNSDFIVLDVGVGTGNTIKPMLAFILNQINQKKFKQSDLNRLKILLFDVDPQKINLLKNAIVKVLKIPKENIICGAGDFCEIERLFTKYMGKIDCIVSGATVCHECNKQQLFTSLYKLAKTDGDVVVWDPAFSLTYANYLQVADVDELEEINREILAKKERNLSSNSKINNTKFNKGLNLTTLPEEIVHEEYYGARIIYQAAKNNDGILIPIKKLITLKREEKLPENILQMQAKGVEIVAVTKISRAMAKRQALFTSLMYPLQLGYRSGAKYINEDGVVEHITSADETKMIKMAQEYILDKMTTKPGYSFLEFIKWLNQNQTFKSCLFEVNNRSKYQLIEAFEDAKNYESYLRQAGFNLKNFAYLAPPTSIDRTSAGCCIFYLKK